jgi:hypothetical protein
MMRRELLSVILSMIRRLDDHEDIKNPSRYEIPGTSGNIVDLMILDGGVVFMMLMILHGGTKIGIW